MNFNYSAMIVAQYEEMHSLWLSVPEVRLNDADERERIKTYLLRNPEQSFICKAGEQIVGTILCGNDGRRAFIYHLTVSPDYRRSGIATELVRLAIDKQKLLGIDKCAVFVLDENSIGKSFWESLGFTAVREAETMSKNI